MDAYTETYTYDKNNQVTKLINEKSDGTLISSYEYTYDAAGNQLSKLEEKGTTTYEYDGLKRLSKVTEPNGKITTYIYDKAGNRTSEVVTLNGTTTTTGYTYNEQNRLTSTVTNGVVTSYIYDDNGNTLTKTVGNKTDSYTYDKYNRLITLITGGKQSTYQYNADGYRVRKTVDGKTTNYLYEGDKVILETNASNQQSAYQIYGTNLLYREVIADGDMLAQKYYYLYNAHGDVTALINSNGMIAATYDYDAFGNIISQTGIANNYIKYTGYQHDGESGLYYLNARYYDSTIARFISEDTYRGKKEDPLSLNLYTYCYNSPIIYHDPSGNIVITVSVTTLILIGSIVVGVAAAAHTAYKSHKYTGKIDWGSTIMVGMSWFSLSYTLGMSSYMIYLDYCAYYGQKPVTEVKFNSNAKVPIGNTSTVNSSANAGKTTTTNTNKSNTSTNSTNGTYKTPAQIANSSPIKIPSSAKVVEQTKTGYNQIKYTWSEGTYKYEARWHTRTPGAPAGQGNTWVITRITPGNASGQQKVQHIMTGVNQWTSMKQWQDAVTARQNGTATLEQQKLLDSGHWTAP